ncbi:MAG TPA: FHA domain-containing protein [Solirubrobacteraceae bacterium]|nr:FHA domain-containing protein [Solirubrobacteraceae bacterium]
MGKPSRKGKHGMESLTSGTIAGTGSFRCRRCGYVLTLAGSDKLSDCPGCGGSDFVRASLFSAGNLGRAHRSGAAGAGARGRIVAGSGRAGAAGAGEADTLGGALSRPEPIDGDAWLQDTRERIVEPGEYLAYEEGDELKLVALTREWTRIGRSLAADVRFDDPTVSRRHALVVRQADGVRVLDDRSLNGVFVNGSRIEWKVLQDGDEILVGRYRLRFLSIPPEPDQTPSATALRRAG